MIDVELGILRKECTRHLSQSRKDETYELKYKGAQVFNLVSKYI